jgi:hypothetical protein
MHYGSGSGSEFGSGSDIKCNKVNNKKREANVLINNTASDIEKAENCSIIVRNWNFYQHFTKVGTGTATNHYGSTTLSAKLVLMTKSVKFTAEKNRI